MTYALTAAPMIAKLRKASLAEMAELAKGKLRNKIPQLQLALEGELEEPSPRRYGRCVGHLRRNSRSELSGQSLCDHYATRNPSFMPGLL